MRATIAIPTRDRARVLDGCLAALVAERADDRMVEIVVVDNGSTDDTARVVDDWSARAPDVRRVAEPVPGVSRARNTGIAAARGDVVVFVDDDVRPDPGWLAAILGPFDRSPEVGVVCGPARLLLDGPLPPWLGPATEAWYSAQDFGPVARYLGPGEVPWSLNLAVRADLARAVGGFPEHLGRVGRDLRSGEEPPFLARVRGTGAVVAYEPAASVLHLVPAERLHVRWLLRRAWAQGAHDHEIAVAVSGTDAPPRPLRRLGRAAFRGWRAMYRRARRVGAREALVSDLCWRTSCVASAWAAWAARTPVAEGSP